MFLRVTTAGSSDNRTGTRVANYIRQVVQCGQTSPVHVAWLLMVNKLYMFCDTVGNQPPAHKTTERARMLPLNGHSLALVCCEGSLRGSTSISSCLLRP